MARRLVVRNPARLAWNLVFAALLIAGILAWRARSEYPPDFSQRNEETVEEEPAAGSVQPHTETEAEEKQRIATQRAQIRAVEKALAAKDATQLARLLDEGLPADLILPDDPEVVTHEHSLLWLAAEAGRTDLVQLLLDRGADAGQMNYPTMLTPLFSAVQQGNIEMARLLVEHGADPYREAKQGVSILSQALGEGSEEMLSMLVNETRCEPESSPSRPPLTHVIELGRERSARILVEAGVGLDEQDEEGATPLHLAAQQNLATLCELLIQKGARVNEPDREGRTPLDRALAARARGAAQVLEKRGGRTAASGRAKGALRRTADN